MSWLSDTVDRVRREVDRVGDKSTEALPKSWRGAGRKAFRYGVASMGGGMGLQYEYSRNKGMNSNEATKNAISGGAQYSEARQMQESRGAAETAREAAADLERKRVAEETRARGQIAARVRRGQRDSRNTKGGTLATGPGGLGGAGTFSSFAALLGL